MSLRSPVFSGDVDADVAKAGEEVKEEREL